MVIIYVKTYITKGRGDCLYSQLFSQPKEARFFAPLNPVNEIAPAHSKSLGSDARKQINQGIAPIRDPHCDPLIQKHLDIA